MGPNTSIVRNVINASVPLRMSDFSSFICAPRICWRSTQFYGHYHLGVNISRTGDWTRDPPAKSFRLVRGRPLDVIDDEDLDGTFGRFEFKSELFLQSCKD